MMNIQELQLIAREQLPIAILIINNKGLGMIENYQKLAFDGRLNGSRWGYSAPDFSALARAFGIEYINAEKLTDSGWLRNDKPMLVEIEV